MYLKENCFYLTSAGRIAHITLINDLDWGDEDFEYWLCRGYILGECDETLWCVDGRYSSWPSGRDLVGELDSEIVKLLFL